MKVRTRFAPSPTGYMHIGGIRTALYCYALAQKHGGSFILRIEDTDRSRYSEEAAEQIYVAMDAYKLVPNESDKHGGDFGPYTQSERLDLYKQAAEELVVKGAAYYCFLTPEEADEIREACRVENRAFRSPHRDLSAEEVSKRLESGAAYVVRQRVPSGRQLDFEDGTQGKMSFETDDLDEGVLLKTDGFPTYHLAMLVDDHKMEITHVFRGFEWIPSIPKHILLYEAMGWQMPQMYHLSTILNSDGKGKLSKRKGSVSAMQFLEEGYLAEAVLNFLMILGWSSPEERKFGESEREIYSLEEFVDLFALEDLNKSNPIFNRDKLLWFNQQYISQKSAAELTEIVKSWISKHSLESESPLLADSKAILQKMLEDESLESKLALVSTRAKTLAELPALLDFFYVKSESIDWEIKQLKKIQDKLSAIREDIITAISNLPEASAEWQHEDWEQALRAIGDKHEVKHGEVFMTLRVAVVGGPFSPPLFECLQILGKSETLARLNAN